MVMVYASRMWAFLADHWWLLFLAVLGLIEYIGWREMRGNEAQRLLDRFRLPLHRPKIRPLDEQTPEDMTLDEARARIISLGPSARRGARLPPAKKPRR